MVLPKFRPFILVLGLVLVLSGLVAPMGLAPSAEAATNAGTIVYIKNYNVWIAKGDGSGQIRVTADGSETGRYSSPTMADNGVISVLRGSHVIRLRTNGVELSRWDAGTLLPEGQAVYDVTTALAVSPNGKNVAYNQSAWKGPGYSVATGTRFSAAARYSNVSEQELSRSGPSWVTNNRVLLRSWNSIYLRDLASGASVEWFEDGDFPRDCDYCDEELWAPELSRDGTRLVAMRGPTSDPQLKVYVVAGNARTGTPPVPTESCTWDGGGDDEFDEPTIAPNNKSLAWQMADGIWIKSNLNNCGVNDARLAIPGGSEPFWSSAGYQAPAKNGSSGLMVVKAPAISGKAQVGKKLKVSKGSWSASPSKYTFQWKRNGKAIKKATKASYRVKAADAGKRLTVTVTAKRAGNTKGKATSAAKAIGFVNTKKPTVSGQATVGTTLTAKQGVWSGSPKSYRFQWFSGATKVKGATGKSYTVRPADAGKKIRVKVTAKRKGFPKTSAFSGYRPAATR